ncbi:alpha/beta hydrolase [Microbacterium gorillae]|uniref:alpha/beta hydrolase n=1 Tax=Microbacterium gorillae TaxID=1231063 RepID=UPI000A9EB922|nr:alpha/beta hydrolase [Microbacterium gorillae]
MSAIRGVIELPARREDVRLRTADGETLVGELALPEHARPAAMLVLLHPLPTAGGDMESHVLRKAAARLPALAGFGILRFNTRGTSSPRGASSGRFGEGETEGRDLSAALAFVRERELPTPWVVGWSFGTEIALKHGREHEIAGTVLLSPPLRRTSVTELSAWSGDPRPMVAIVPELDHLLAPEAARERFAVVPHARLVAVAGARHLWVGETQTRRVLQEIVDAVRPEVGPLPLEWSELSARSSAE